MYTEKRINKRRAHAIYGILPSVLLCAFVWSCAENEFPPAEEKAMNSYTLRLSASGLAAGELEQVSSLDAYVFGYDCILKNIIMDIPVKSDGTNGTISFQAAEGDSVYFISDSRENGLYENISPYIGHYSSKFKLLDSTTPEYFSHKGESPLLFYRGGPFAIGSGKSLKLECILARIDLKIQDNSRIKVSKIYFTNVPRTTNYFGSYIIIDMDHFTSMKTFDEPVSGTVKDVFSLYGDTYLEVNIEAFFGDSKDTIRISNFIRDVKPNRIYTLLVKEEVGNTAVATVEASPWEEGNTIDVQPDALGFRMLDHPEPPGIKLDGENFSVTVGEIQEELTFTLTFVSNTLTEIKVAPIENGNGIKFGNGTRSVSELNGSKAYATSYDVTIPAQLPGQPAYTSKFAVGISPTSFPGLIRELKIHVPAKPQD